MKIFFVRHGRTEWNNEGRFQGYTGDSPLLAESYHQLDALGKYLSPVTFDRIYSSDLKRAAVTAQHIQEANPKNPPVQETKQLREWNFGKLEGTKINLFKEIYPREYEAIMENPIRFHHDIFEAESITQCTNRIIDFIHSLKDQDAEEVLIVSHGTVLTATVQLLLGAEIGEVRKHGGLRNASVTVLETQDFEEFKVLDWNDISYQEDESKRFHLDQLDDPSSNIYKKLV